MLSLSNLILSCCVTIYFYLKKLHPTILFTQIDEKYGLLFRVSFSILMIFTDSTFQRKIYDEIFTIYMPTYLHLSPYLIGIFTGYFIVISRETSFRFPKVFKWGCEEIQLNFSKLFSSDYNSLGFELSMALIDTLNVDDNFVRLFFHKLSPDTGDHSKLICWFSSFVMVGFGRFHHSLLRNQS